MYMVSQHTQTLAFVEAMHGLFIVTAIITALGIPLALMMRSGPSKSAEVPADPPRRIRPRRAPGLRPSVGRPLGASGQCRLNRQHRGSVVSGRTPRSSP